MLTSYKTQLDEFRLQMSQYEKQVDTLKNIVIQVHQGQMNLASLKVTNLQDVSNLLSQLEGQLAQAQYVNYRAQQAREQAEALYKKTTGHLTAAQQQALARQWAAAQRDSAALAIETQAIQEQDAQIRGQWQAVQQRAAAAQGNLEIAQAQAQGQALLGAQLQGIAQQLATAAREQSQRNMREASRIEMEQNALQATTQPLDTTYTPQGKTFTLSTGRE